MKKERMNAHKRELAKRYGIELIDSFFLSARRYEKRLERINEMVVAEKMAFTHPTLQQSFMRLCRTFIQLMAKKERYDARNENSVKMARKMMDAIEDTALPMI